MPIESADNTLDNDSYLELEDDPEIDSLGDLFDAHCESVSSQVTAHVGMSFTAPPTFTVCVIKGAEWQKWAWPQPWVEARDAGRIRLAITYNNEYARKH